MRVLLCLSLVAIAGCGAGESSEDSPLIPGSATMEDKELIVDWAKALSKGDLYGAAGYFALPSIVQNGTEPIRIRNRSEARLFNKSLPCGASLTQADADERAVTASFRLTERPGGDCGQGTGGRARTRFVLKGGKIAVWERLVDEPEIRGPVV